MGNGIFITGTDTGVGKTFVACSLAAALRGLGYRVGVMKPAETGCEKRDGVLFPNDAVALKNASGTSEPLDRICPYRFSEPLAPSIAAERAGVRIDIDHLLTVYDDIKAKHDVVLLEGAGGLMVPLLPSYTYADLARVLKLPIVVVAANKLGVINHLLLTLEHAGCKGLNMLGYVLNGTSSVVSLAAETNREVLAGLTGMPCLGELPYVEAGESQNDFTRELFTQEFDMRLIEPMLGRLQANGTTR